MEDPVVVTVSLEKPNLVYAVTQYCSLEEMTDPIIDLLKDSARTMHFT
jgi:hypothetical protein